MNIRNAFFILVGLVFWVGCATPGTSETEATPDVVMSTPRPPVTLAPTYTPSSTQAPLPTITPPTLSQETAVPDTPIPFDETVLELHYQIPLLGLDRRLQGNVANQLIVVDEASGHSIQRSNEGSVMFELRQALSGMELSPLPEECPGCVYVAYELSDAGLSGSGWLKDPVLLASIENFMSATLGPHYPDDTLIGLRRSASPYAPGHTIAITEDGRLWRWLATEAEVSPPASSEASVPLLADLTQIPLAALDDTYQAECRGVPIESLTLKQADESWTGRIVCPELTLPTTLQPLYVGLDALLAEKTAVATTSQLDSTFPLDGLMLYKRNDNAQLTLYPNSTLIAIDPLGAVYTSTLTSTLPVSLTTSLLETGLLEPGFKTFIVTSSDTLSTTVTVKPPSNILAVRGVDGVYDAEWFVLPTHEALAELNNLLNAIISPASSAAPAPDETPESTEATATP